jgi:DNA-binding transcriptional LysR family regulator
MLDVRRLAVLAAAVREGSIASAARRLDLTPSAASQALSALETQASTRLLDRLPRGVRPTPAGERLAAHAEAVLAVLETAEAELARGTGGNVRIAAFPTAVIGLLPGALSRVREQAPDLTIQVLELEPAAARAALRNSDVDLALVNHHALLSPDTDGPWQVVHIRDEPVLAALPLGHPLAGAPSVSVARLADQPWILQQPASPCQELVHLVCAAAGFAPRVVATCGDYRSILGLAMAGHGVSLVPELALTGLDISGVALLPTRPKVARRINALVSARLGASPATRTMVDALLCP